MGEEAKTPPSRKLVASFGRFARSCLARRHWNSASYRSAAGISSEGENRARFFYLYYDYRQRRFHFAAMELTGIEPVTSAVRLQRSPS